MDAFKFEAHVVWNQEKGEKITAVVDINSSRQHIIAILNRLPEQFNNKQGALFWNGYFLHPQLSVENQPYDPLQDQVFLRPSRFSFDYGSIPTECQCHGNYAKCLLSRCCTGFYLTANNLSVIISCPVSKRCPFAGNIRPILSQDSERSHGVDILSEDDCLQLVLYFLKKEETEGFSFDWNSCNNRDGGTLLHNCVMHCGKVGTIIVEKLLDRVDCSIKDRRGFMAKDCTKKPEWTKIWKKLENALTTRKRERWTKEQRSVAWDLWAGSAKSMICLVCNDPTRILVPPDERNAGFDLAHVIPDSQHGPMELWNLVVCCPSCNNENGVQNLLEWGASQKSDLPKVNNKLDMVRALVKNLLAAHASVVKGAAAMSERDFLISKFLNERLTAHQGRVSYALISKLFPKETQQEQQSSKTKKRKRSMAEEMAEVQADVARLKTEVAELKKCCTQTG